MPNKQRTLIESDEFPVDFLSILAERESWRKEVHRPLQHVHKWWAKRLGSVFRGILLGCTLPDDADLASSFYRQHDFSTLTVFDPFMGSGTTISEAHKLGLVAVGRDINPVAVEAVRVALSRIDHQRLEEVFQYLDNEIGESTRHLYRSLDSRGRLCDVLYYFWVMQAECPACDKAFDLFPSYVIAQNAYPKRKPEVQVLCPVCGGIFEGKYGESNAVCRHCNHAFNPEDAPAKGAKATCPHCVHEFSVIASRVAASTRPNFRLYAKLVLTAEDNKEYLPATNEDIAAFAKCSEALNHDLASRRITLPDLHLDQGFNTRQAMNYGFSSWKDFFNDRQLLVLGRLQAAIAKISDIEARDALLILFSGVLEFNNLFASYKGEGTGAVRHMFSHHILKPERVPIEANVWGTPKSSGSFSNLFRSRLLRASEYQRMPTELGAYGVKSVVSSLPYTGTVDTRFPRENAPKPRGIYLSCGDSADSGLPDKSVDIVATDPPFFDNVHYSELADFFFAWQCLFPRGFIQRTTTTRNPHEVQDTSSEMFSAKLAKVLTECRRVLRDDGLLVFTYHHSRDEGWLSVGEAILRAGFCVVNAQPVKAEMSVAMPKSQAKEPIQLDTILVCRKRGPTSKPPMTVAEAARAVERKLSRLRTAGLKLSKNDEQVVTYGQLLATVGDPNMLQARAKELQTMVGSMPVDSRLKDGQTEIQRLSA